MDLALIANELAVLEGRILRRPEQEEQEQPQRGCWKTDLNNEACYIDIETDNEDDEDVAEADESAGGGQRHREYSQWNDLPDLLLERIFAYLPIRERYYASLVCRNWYGCFYLPRVWTNFLVDDHTLTRQRYNYYSGWQHTLDHLRTQYCLTKIGRYIKGLDFRPMHSFNNLYQFMTLVSWCIEQGRKPNPTDEVRGIGDRITSLNYVFPCNMAAPDDPDGIKLFGTGGQLLAELKRLMGNIKCLKALRLIDLMLNRYEAKHLLDEVLESAELTRLTLVNVTMTHCPIMHVGLFLNLRVLIISPQNIDDDVITLLADSRLEHLHLLQNSYTPPSVSITACSAKAWRILKLDNPELMVHLRVESITENGEVLLQPEAPVRSILHRAPKSRMKAEGWLRVVDMYKTTLEIFGYEALPEEPRRPAAATLLKVGHVPDLESTFDSRADSLLVLMARQCPKLGILIINEPVSTSTLLLIARAASNLRHFYVRAEAVICACDWPRHPEWSAGYYEWLRVSSERINQTEEEISKILGHRWRTLPDNLFASVTVDVRQKL